MTAKIDFEKLGRAFFDWAVAQGVFAVGPGMTTARHETSTPPQFFTIPELAERWRIARPTVYTRLQKLGIKVLDLSPGTARGRKVVPRSAVLEAESRQLKRF